jgi:hypothetical protein
MSLHGATSLNTLNLVYRCSCFDCYGLNSEDINCNVELMCLGIFYVIMKNIFINLLVSSCRLISVLSMFNIHLPFQVIS